MSNTLFAPGDKVVIKDLVPGQDYDLLYPMSGPKAIALSGNTVTLGDRLQGSHGKGLYHIQGMGYTISDQCILRKITEYKVGDTVVLTTTRPEKWATSGKMDKYLGATVVINSIDKVYFSFEGSSPWTFRLSDIDHVEEIHEGKYQVGDLVVVRYDPQNHWDDEGQMRKFCGKTMTIESIDSDGDIHFEECGRWFWKESDIISKVNVSSKPVSSTDTYAIYTNESNSDITQGKMYKVESSVDDEYYIFYDDVGDKRTRCKDEFVNMEKLPHPSDRYKIGDTVRFVSERPGHWNAEGMMDKFLGQAVVITNIDCTSFEFYGSSDWTFALSDIAYKIPKDLINKWKQFSKERMSEIIFSEEDTVSEDTYRVESKEIEGTIISMIKEPLLTTNLITPMYQSDIIKDRINEKFFTPKKIEGIVSIVEEIETRVEQNDAIVERCEKENERLQEINNSLNQAVDRKNKKDTDAAIKLFEEFLAEEKAAFADVK